jgi:hypothetical protein
MATSDHTSSVTIRFSKPGTQPPIYLAGSFSHPEWDPQEMEHETKADGELEFTKEVEVQEGKQYQYKFRVGEGEWWVLNEEAPTGRLCLFSWILCYRIISVDGYFLLVIST